jgi:hypothetical protein
MARQQARRQQRERIAGLVVVCLGIAVLVVAIVALREPSGHGTAAAQPGSPSSVAKQSAKQSATQSTPAPSPTSAASSSTPRTDASTSVGGVKDVPLIVLNNTTTTGLAKQAAQRFEAGGWRVTEYNNYQNNIASTCAYYDPADNQAKQAAQALQAQYPTIKRVEPKFPELPTGPIVVVLTPDYSTA